MPRKRKSWWNINPKYNDPFVFTNDFAALLPDTPISSNISDPLFKSESLNGTSRVVCFSPNHNLTLPKMEVENILKVVSVWADQVSELGKKYKWVQVFENKGDIMGCSNPHPHGQIWAGSSIPNEPNKENIQQKEYYKNNESVLLLDYINREVESKERVIIENNEWIVLVPFWAIWPFETILIPKRHVLGLNELSIIEKQSLANILKNS